jgi:cytochrome c oxidase subunit III
VSTDTYAQPETEWKLPSPRKTGVILLIMTESSLFTIFVVAYLFYIGKSLNPPYPREVLEFPWLGSFLLFSSSATIVVAERRLKKKDLGGFHLWWFLTILLGAGFLIYTGAEWYHLITHDGLTISTNLFGSTFYSLVGLHASHVIVGLLLLSIILIASMTGNIQHRHHEHIEMISWYWHFVDGIWAVVVTVVYIIGMQS